MRLPLVASGAPAGAWSGGRPPNFMVSPDSASYRKEEIAWPLRLPRTERLGFAMRVTPLVSP